MKRDAYEVLGVGRDATEAEIKKEFRRLARELHPDVNAHDPAAEEKFKEAAEAYEVLSDPERRPVYDRHGWDGLDSRGFSSGVQGFGSVADIFDSFFGGGFRRGGAVQGGDVAVAVEISLDEAASGTRAAAEFDAVIPCERCHGNRAEPGTPIEPCSTCGGQGQVQTVARSAFGQIMRTQACNTCGGEGSIVREGCGHCGGRGREAVARKLDVDIPAGIADEQRVRLSGRGHAGERGGPAGDLYVVVRVADDERFVRDGDDLLTVVNLNAPTAALGTTITVPTLDGDEELEIPEGTQPGTVFTLRGQGMPSIGRRSRGDQRVVVNVVIPRNLDPDQRAALEHFRSTLSERNLERAREDSMFERLRRALG